MSTFVAAALLVLGSGPIEVVATAGPAFEVGFEELAAGDNLAAISAIEASSLPANDPALLINHGVALARTGDHESAREKFAEVAAHSDRYRLETASGNWVDSRVLARRGLSLIDRGEFEGYAALASR